MRRQGIQIRHRTARSTMIVVEVQKRPYAEPILCPTCRVAHVFKAVHLWLDGSGSCVVSQGVLDDLKLAGMPNMWAAGTVKNPPTLTVGHHVDRAEVDFRNRSQTIYKLEGFQAP